MIPRYAGLMMLGESGDFLFPKPDGNCRLPVFRVSRCYTPTVRYVEPSERFSLRSPGLSPGSLLEEVHVATSDHKLTLSRGSATRLLEREEGGGFYVLNRAMGGANTYRNGDAADATSTPSFPAVLSCENVGKVGNKKQTEDSIRTLLQS